MLGQLLHTDGFEPIQEPTKPGYSIHDLVNRDGRKAVIMKGSVIAVPRPSHVYTLNHRPHLGV